ncbi:MAG TPA: hypothetical protein VEX15_09000 [Nocardioidaceae bacterium]|nr:hypothetical protein [Nocardioidaceae bacterium]
MTRVDEFDAFYHDSRRQVLHQTYALTGDLNAAIVAVQDAYAHAWQHWTKLRLTDPLGQVRPEAMRLASLRRSTHLLRRKRREETDTELLEALGAMSSTARRLVLLQTAGGLDIAGAAREVGMTADDAVELTDRAVTELEDRLNASTGQIERRLHYLRRITDAATLPRASTIRRSGTRRKHRNTLIAVATSAAVIAGAGYLVTAPADGRSESLHPTRAQIGHETDPADDAIGASEDQLLSAPQIVHLDLKANWTVAETSSDLDAIDPFATCALARYGTPQLRQVWVRTFTGAGKTSQYAIESIEVARSKAAARASYRTQLNWYAGCQVPRVQLLEAYSVARDGTDIRILVLRKWSDPIRTITIGVARSGFITSTFVHQAESRHGPSVSAFADVLDDSLGLLCENTGGICQLASDVRPVQPPVTGEANGFLGAVDLPPVANLAKVMVGTEPEQYPAAQNPAATSCDEAQFKGKGLSGVRSRSYVVLDAKQVPTTFGITETIATFPSEARAKNYLKRLAKRLNNCEDRNYAANVRGPHRDGEGAVRASTWWLSLEATSKMDIEYRVALVRNGARVAQVMFTPVGRFDVSSRAFNALAIRAGQRLTELQ